MSREARASCRLLAASAAAALLGVASSANAQLVFEPPVASSAGSLALRALVGDVNDDGLADVVVNHFLFGPQPTLMLGLGGGSFAASPTVVGGSARGLADFNGDGHLDLLVIAGGAPPLNVSVRLGAGDGSFGALSGVNSNHAGPVDADVGDFNGDGAPDIAILNNISGFSPGALTVTYGHGDGSFEAPLIVVPALVLSISGIPTATMRVGDTNGDGRDDILYVHSTGSPLLLAQAEGGFLAAPGSASLFETDFLFADLNGDGRQDVLTPRRALLANAAGALVAGQFFPTPAGAIPYSVGAGDFDGDGHVDVVLGRNGSGQLIDFAPVGDVLVQRGLGNGSFEFPGTVVSHVPQPAGVIAADVNADGRLDIVAAEMQQDSGTMRALLNHTYGAGSVFEDLGHALAGANGTPIQLADGSLLAGQPFSFRLASGPANGAAYHIVGIAQLDAPFKGGVLVPTPTLLNGPLPLDAGGGITLAGAWPGGAEGMALFLQFWMPAGGGPKGFVASSAVRAQVP